MSCAILIHPKCDDSVDHFFPVLCQPDQSPEGRQLIAFEVLSPEFRPAIPPHAIYTVTVEVDAPAHPGDLVWIVVDEYLGVGSPREMRLVHCLPNRGFCELDGTPISMMRNPFYLGRVVDERLSLDRTVAR